MYKIFIVEDDPTIAGAVSRHMESWGYQTRCAEDFKDVMAEFVRFAPQLVMLDISLPFFSGMYWCEAIRKISKVPIIFVSSAGDNMNIVMAMSLGADDFIVKPFDLSVLLAKTQAVLRRSYDLAGQTGLLEHNGAILNTGDCSLCFGDGKLQLTKNENRILSILFENAGSVVSRDSMMTRLWETDLFVDENTLSVNVTRLRKKLEAFGMTDWIVTKKGLGYMVE